MINSIKAEFRKVISIRSTYVILLICLGIQAFLSFYATGYKLNTAGLQDPTHLTDQVVTSVTFLATLISLVGVLLMTHEYRYNTILYTLSSAHRRTQVLVAKLIVVSLFALIFTALFAAAAPLFSWLGIHAAGHELVHQNGVTWELVARALFGGWAFSVLALIIAVLVRAQVAAIACIFLIPGTVEILIGLVLKKNQVYLPFSSINAVLVHPDGTNITFAKAAMIAACWLVGGSIAAWIWFERRDAN